MRGPLLLGRSKADVLALHKGLVSAAVVRAIHARGATVLAWTANEPDLVSRLSEAGVDAISSDDPGMALDAARPRLSDARRFLPVSWLH